MGSVTPRSTARSPFPSENGRHSAPQQAPSATLNSAGKRLGFQPQYPPQYVMPPMQHALPRTFRPTVIDPSYPASTDPNYPVSFSRLNTALINIKLILTLLTSHRCDQRLLCLRLILIDFITWMTQNRR